MMPAVRSSILVFTVGLVLLLQGCAEMVVGGAATGAAVVHDRRTPGTVIDDELIELKAAERISADTQISEQVHINATSYNNILLLSGEAPTEAIRAQIGDMMQGIPKLRRVHNEIVVAAPSSMLTRTSDTWITTKVKSSLVGLDDLPDFDPTRVKVVSENGTVFLLGIVKREEADAATNVARQISGVQRVVKLFEYIN
jgi:osmotically-inducible protein OsmY